MVKRLLILITMLLLGVPVMAQNVPDPINAALADLSARSNRNVTLAQVNSWNYQQSVYPSPALGCPQPGIAYADVVTGGYQFIITYAGNVYDYRVSDDQSIVVLCGTAPVPVAAPECPPSNDESFITPRLSKGIQARVIEGGLPNVLREQAGSSSKLLGQIPPGDSFIVLNGPRCTILDKIIWWQINYNNLIGWTGEGQNGTYWVEPMDIKTTPTPLVAPVEAVAINAANAPVMSEIYSTNNVSIPLVEDDTILIMGSATGMLTLLDYHTNSEIAKVSAHHGAVTSLASGVNSTAFVSYIASGGADGMIKIWEVDPQTRALEMLVEINGHNSTITSLAFDEDGEMLASGGADKSVRLWQVSDGKSLAVLKGHQAAVTSVRFGAMAVYSRDASGITLVWGIPTGTSVG